MIRAASLPAVAKVVRSVRMPVEAEWQKDVDSLCLAWNCYENIAKLISKHIRLGNV
jgi:hypothetical protein